MPPVTRICRSTADAVYVRERDLAGEMIGRATFTEAMFFAILGRDPTPDQAALVDACLVAIMEHGLTPSAIATRLTYGSAPEAMQSAVAAGLAGVGSRFVGTMDGCAALLTRVVAAADRGAEATAVVAEHRAARRPLPGFGHPQHTPDDPRAVRLLALARERGVAGAHVDALERIARELDGSLGKHVPINATGAIAAVLGDCGVPAEIHRGFALIARCAGLVAHVREEQTDPAFGALWHGGEVAVPYAEE